MIKDEQYITTNFLGAVRKTVRSAQRSLNKPLLQRKLFIPMINIRLDIILTKCKKKKKSALHVNIGNVQYSTQK